MSLWRLHSPGVNGELVGWSRIGLVLLGMDFHLPSTRARGSNPSPNQQSKPPSPVFSQKFHPKIPVQSNIPVQHFSPVFPFPVQKSKPKLRLEEVPRDGSQRVQTREVPPQKPREEELH